YPIRSGVHPNTAFGFAFAHDFAVATGHKKLKELIEERARAYYLNDTNIPAKWEPDGADFLSPSLCEADLMRRGLAAGGGAAMVGEVIPRRAQGGTAPPLHPPPATRPTDPPPLHPPP